MQGNIKYLLLGSVLTVIVGIVFLSFMQKGEAEIVVGDANGMNPGVIEAYSGKTIPDGYLLCDGSAVSRTTYADLFEIIGTTYGEGDGSTTFNLPDLSGRTIIGTSSSHELASTGGEEEHTLTISEMPSHSHNPNHWDVVTSPGTTSGDLYSYFLSMGNYTGAISTYATASSRQSYATTTTGGSAAHNNMQPYMTLNYIIKY